MTTLAVQVGVDTLRTGRSIHVTGRFCRQVERAFGNEAVRLVSKDSSKPGWIVLRLAPVSR